MIEVKCRAEQLDIHHADLRGGRFETVNLSGAAVSSANLSRLTIQDATAPGAVFDDVNMAGTTFETVSLKGGSAVNADLSLMTTNNCNIAGLRLDGVEIAPLLAQRKAAANG